MNIIGDHTKGWKKSNSRGLTLKELLCSEVPSEAQTPDGKTSSWPFEPGVSLLVTTMKVRA